MPKEGGGCRNCGSLVIDKELAQGQQLCVPCLKSLPRISCRFCTVTFQQLPESKRNSKVQSDVCFICEHQFLKHGGPNACACCGNNAAFVSEHCKLCASAIAKYGNPVPCSKCQTVRAFDRPEKRTQLQGRNYCFSCSRALKSESSSSSHKKPEVAAPDSLRASKAKERTRNKETESQDKSRPSTSDRTKRSREDSSSLSEPHTHRGAAAESSEREIAGLRRLAQEANDRAVRLEARCKQLELECQESKQKHALSIKELDSYVCAHNMEKYQSKSREAELKDKLSMLQAQHSRLKSDYANLEAAQDIKTQNEVSIWRSRVAQLEDQLRDVSKELKELRS
jgi:hypothetical protein